MLSLLAALPWLSACNEILGRLPKAHLSFAGTHNDCPLGMVPVGDTLAFHAQVMINNSNGGMQGAFDGTTLYDSWKSPRSFAWSVNYPPPASGTIGKALIRRNGVLVGQEPGLLSVVVKSAGMTSTSGELHVVPEVLGFTVVPRETSVKVGDTLVVRAEVELDGPMRRGYDFTWIRPLNEPQRSMMEQVEVDPDLPHVDRNELELPLVASNPGTYRVIACLAGTRADTAVIHIEGAPPVVTREVPPALKVIPSGQSIYIGDRFYLSARVLNARLMNGPYTWRASFDGAALANGVSASRGSSSAFGLRIDMQELTLDTRGAHTMEVTVTDAAGRSTTVAAKNEAVPRTFTVRLAPEAGTTIHISDTASYLPVVIVSDTAKKLWPGWIQGSPYATERLGAPPIKFGNTVFDPLPSGKLRKSADVTGDGQKDEIFYVDRALMKRNGDLRPGLNRLVVSGGTQYSPTRVLVNDGRGHYAPFEGVLEFWAVP